MFSLYMYMYIMNDIKEIFFFNILSILSDINTQLKIKSLKGFCIAINMKAS